MKKAFFILLVLFLAWVLFGLVKNGGLSTFFVGTLTGATIVQIYHLRAPKKQEAVKEEPKRIMVDDSVLQLAEILRGNYSHE